MSDGSGQSVLVGRNGDSEVIKPLVPCSAALAGVIGSHLASTGDVRTTDIYFDLSRTARIDSTFAGLMVSLVGGRDGRPGAVVHVAHPSDEVRGALANMHLLGFFDLCDGVPCPPPSWRALGDPPGDAERLCDLIVESHKTLVDADERNGAVFARVIDTFETERKRLGGDTPED